MKSALKKINPTQLVSMPPIEFDPTLELWIQKIRFDFVVPFRPFECLKVQILLDRVHRFHRKLSRPVAYFHLSNPLKLQELAAQAIAAAAVLALSNSRKPVPSAFDVQKAVESQLDSIITRAYDLAYTYSRLVQDRKVKLSIEKLLEAK